ncbi:MAG: type III PLP-dependent enzyme [Alphaproteobacteria bacterium]|nr:type III PLP-dependent enzyme [Alphaproteobacteria bacterium]
MKNSTTEPPGSLRNTVSNPSHTVQIAKAPSKGRLRATKTKFSSVDQLVFATRPDMPVHIVRPATITSTAKWFLKQFPGDVLFAVKTNPDPIVLATLAKAGVAHFDVASLGEVKLVAENVPSAEMYFMHPVKSREAIHAAYYDYGVRSYSLDSLEELTKILQVTGYARDLNLYVRLSIPNEHAAMSLCGKFGVATHDAAELLIETRKVAAKLGVCFHVGSQCMDPSAYVTAMALTANLVRETGVKLDVLDIGGGFPSVYPGMTPPSLSSYMETIRAALKAEPLFASCQIVCEPGRALVAEGGSTLVRVELRKAGMLYINDGVYGSLFDAGTPAFVYPVRAIRMGGEVSQQMQEFSFYGPTCDSLDVMHGPFTLPSDIREGDWIEIGQLGAYGATMRTNFNGFRSDATVEVADKPLLSIFGTN